MPVDSGASLSSSSSSVPLSISTPAVDPVISKFISDLDADAALAKEVFEAYKAGGAGKAIAAATPLIGSIVSQIADAKAAIPALKSGFKTTEGIASIVVAVGLPILAHFTPSISSGTATAIDIVSGVVAAVYTISRAFLKVAHVNAAADAVASVAASTKP
jgi:hypothetical protein